MRHLPSQRASAWDLLRVVSCGDAFTLEQLGPLFDLSAEELRPAVDWLCGLGLLAEVELFGESWFLVTMRGHLILAAGSIERLLGDESSEPANVG